MLPRSEAHAVLFAQLSDIVRSQGGSALVFVTQTMSAAEHEALVARFQSDRAREYAEFAERSRGFLDEIERETQLQKFTFAELEEIEDDHNKLSAWLAKIGRRDFYPDYLAQEATDTLQRCGRILRVFAEAVYACEGIADQSDQADPTDANDA